MDSLNLAALNTSTFVVSRGLGEWANLYPLAAGKFRCHCGSRSTTQSSITRCLTVGDAVSITGSLELETAQGPKGRKLTGLFVLAGQVLPLRRRSVNRMPAFAGVR